MKKYFRSFFAAAVCSAVMLAGCSDKKAQTSDSGAENTAAAATQAAQSGSSDSSRPQKTTEFTVIKSTDAGNSGDVKLEKGDTYAVITVKDYGTIKIKLYPDLAPYAVYNFTELAKKGTYNGRTFHRLIEDFMIQGGSAGGNGSPGECIDGGTFKNYINTSLRHYYGALCYSANAAGDMSDGFYIVNNNKPQSDLSELYEKIAANYSAGASQGEAILATLDPSMDQYQLYYDYYNGLTSYNAGAADAVAALKDTVTDAVKSTYAEKGGVPSLDGRYTVFGQTVEGFDVIDKITAVEKTVGADNAVSKPVTDIIIDKIEIFTME